MLVKTMLSLCPAFTEVLHIWQSTVTATDIPELPNAKKSHL